LLLREDQEATAPLLTSGRSKKTTVIFVAFVSYSLTLSTGFPHNCALQLFVFSLPSAIAGAAQPLQQ